MREIDTVLLQICILLACLLSILLLLYGYLMFRKLLFNRRRAQEKALLQHYITSDSDLEGYLKTGYAARRMTRLSRLEADVLQETLYRRIHAGSTPEEKSLIVQFAERHFTPIFKDQLQSRRWSTRLNTLLYMERFRLGTLTDRLEALLVQKHCTDTERFLILRMLVAFRHSNALDWLAKYESTLSNYQIVHILLPLHSEQLHDVLSSFDAFMTRIQLLLIDVIRIKNERSEQVLALLERLMQDEREEFRIRSLKALANFGYMTDEAILRLMTQLEQTPEVSWEERMMRAKLMGSMTEEAFIPVLERLMSDKVYLVRQQAAYSISRYKHGEQMLQEVTMQHEDRYAREMAKETLERIRYERKLA